MTTLAINNITNNNFIQICFVITILGKLKNLDQSPMIKDAGQKFCGFRNN